ncbi:MAG: ATP-dependent helicase HrpB [Actinobacteria bacterium]|nr:ATP-dependent helicase HrpB [Actinomycetota bacterium]
MTALPDLPVTAEIARVRRALSESRRCVLTAPPGAGKTTLVPLALLDDLPTGGRVVLLEPRRLAARAAARRMAQLLGESVGDTVGLRTRDERIVGPTTRIEVLTEGVLTRRLQSDPELPGVSIVIFDEVHERNLTTDLGLALCLDVASTIRPDLALLAMSATADTDRLSRLLDGAPVIVSEGRTHPVDQRWIPTAQGTRIEDAVVAATERALADNSGDILVFLPGIAEIMRVVDRLRLAVESNVDVLPLAGSLTLEEQDAALRPSGEGRRRVVVSTDIAETSLTVEGVRIVVDSGLARAPRHDPATGMTRLTTVTTSRSSATQRAGRAGREAPGVAYALWSKIEHGTRLAHPTPEISEADLASFLLESLAWGSEPDDLRLITPPPVSSVRSARALLIDLGAINAEGALTDDGRRMLTLPLHPRLARMVVRHPHPISCVLAALLDERDPLRGRRDELPVDLETRVSLVRGENPSLPNGVRPDHGALDRIRRRAADLMRRATIAGTPSDARAEDAGRALIEAYADRIAMRRRAGQFQLRTGAGAWIPETDPLASEEFIVAADLDGRRDRARVRLAAAVDGAAVIRRFAEIPGLLSERRRLDWDADRDDLVESVERRLGSLRLGTTTARPEPGAETTHALIDRVRVTGLAVLPWNGEALGLRERVGFLRARRGDPWPDWSREGLIAGLDDWLAPYLTGATSRTDLESLDLTMLLRAMLPWPEGADLDRLAPSALSTPAGTTAPISYADGRPVCAVRVQDLFGLSEHPLADGEPLVLELLSPADRPVQVTADLPGFWSGSWSQVRSDMAGRYPKHHWPDDPATAEPHRLKRPPGERGDR